VNYQLNSKKIKTKKLPLAIALAISPIITNAQFDAVFELSSLDGSNGFVVNGVAGVDISGFSVSGACYVDPNTKNLGASYVVFGSDVVFADGFK